MEEHSMFVIASYTRFVFRKNSALIVNDGNERNKQFSWKMKPWHCKHLSCSAGTRSHETIQ